MKAPSMASRSPGRPSDRSPVRVALQASDRPTIAATIASSAVSHETTATPATRNGWRSARSAPVRASLPSVGSPAPPGSRPSRATISRRLARLTSTSTTATTSSTSASGTVESRMSRPNKGTSRSSLGRSSSLLTTSPSRPTSASTSARMGTRPAACAATHSMSAGRSRGGTGRGARPSRSVAACRSAAHRSTAWSSTHAETRMATRTTTPVVSAASNARASKLAVGPRSRARCGTGCSAAPDWGWSGRAT